MCAPRHGEPRHRQLCDERRDDQKTGRASLAPSRTIFSSTTSGACNFRPEGTCLSSLSRGAVARC
eukprot:867053-Pyramimonas_sp.AAC.1